MMTRLQVYAILQRLCLAVGCLCVAAAAILYFFQPDDSVRVVVETAALENLRADADQEVALAFMIRNPTRHPARIVGLTTC